MSKHFTLCPLPPPGANNELDKKSRNLDKHRSHFYLLAILEILVNLVGANIVSNK